MSYIPIYRGYGHGPKIIGMVTVTDRNICFSERFRLKYGIGQYARFYLNDDGFFCVEFFDEQVEACYKVTQSKKGAYFLRLPRFLKQWIDKGHFEVTEQDGRIFVTNCKISTDIDGLHQTKA